MDKGQPVDYVQPDQTSGSLARSTHSEFNNERDTVQLTK